MSPAEGSYLGDRAGRPTRRGWSARSAGDPAEGDDAWQIAPGTRFNALPGTGPVHNARVAPTSSWSSTPHAADTRLGR